MGYAARANPTAQHFRTPEGIAQLRVQREQRAQSLERASASRRRREFDALVAQVNAPDAALRFSPQRLGVIRSWLAAQGYSQATGLAARG